MKKLILLLSVLFVVSCSPEPILYMLTTSVSPVDTGVVIPSTRQYNEGDTATLIATPAAEYVFDKWTGAEGGSETTIVMSSDKTVVANFIKKKYALTTAVEGEGTVTEKIIKAGAATDYNSGTVVELTATPKEGWGFMEWKGDLTGTENPKEITIDKPKTVTAVFETLPPFYLDENGVTIKAYDWVTAGTKGELNGIIYEAVDIDTLRTIFNFGPSNWSEYEPAFKAAEERLSKVVTTLITDMSDLFGNAPTSNSEELFYVYFNKMNPDISSWDVSNVTDMSRMFKRKNGEADADLLDSFDSYAYGLFNQDISKWDVSNVTGMSGMFFGQLRIEFDASSWDVSKVTDMSQMFAKIRNVDHNIGSWDVGNVTNMSFMFAENGNIQLEFENWDVSKVTNMSGMFTDTSSFNQDIGSWDVSNVVDMVGMFSNADGFNQNIGSWDVSNVTSMSFMFLSGKTFNQDIGSWDVSKVTNMKYMFKDASSFNQNLTKWCVTNITTRPTFFSTYSALTAANRPIWGTCPGNSYTIAVTASSNTNYTLSGKDRNGDVSGNDPGLTFKVGDEVTFSVNAAGHPFYLKTVAGTGTGNQISGVTNNGTTSGSVVWTPTAAGTYYYQCGPHAEMVGTITIQN